MVGLPLAGGRPLLVLKQIHSVAHVAVQLCDRVTFPTALCLPARQGGHIICCKAAMVHRNMMNVHNQDRLHSVTVSLGQTRLLEQGRRAVDVCS